MSRTVRSSGPEVPSPDQRLVSDPDKRYDTMQVFATLTEIQKDIIGLSSKTDRAIADLEKLDQKVSSLREAFILAKGFGLAAVILIPICAGFVWWLAGDKLNSIRDELTKVRPAITQQQGQPPNR